MKLCKDCKFFGPDMVLEDIEHQIEFAVCKHPKSTKKNDPVGGKTLHHFCSVMRTAYLPFSWGTCGPKAKWFEPVENATIHYMWNFK